ncbi:hypothetical protein SELMODRAFT_114854, partial [Selaginella moellendorffii]
RFNTQHTSALGIELFGHPLLISQDPNSKHVGTTVWDSSVVFAKFLEKNCNRGQLNGVQMAGKRAIELGAGCGVAGLAMALMGCNVVLTDQVEVLPLLLKNVERNVARIKLASVTSTSESVGNVSVAELDWGNSCHIAALEPPFDFIIGTDVVYAAQHLEPLLTTILSLCGPRATVVLAYEFRSPELTERLQAMCKEHFEIKTISKKKMDACFQHPNIQLLVMSRRRLHNTA